MGSRPPGFLRVIYRAGPALAVLACIVVAGCAPRDDGGNNNRPAGFYGGVSGGMTRP
jgi:hypothetical protein